MKPRARGRTSEDIAVAVLESLGFRIVERRKKIDIDGVDVAEVDIVAEKDGDLYAVEVKAGPADVSTIRYAYANAKMLNMKPLVVARGFSNEAARAVAERLDVKVIELSDLFLTSGEEMLLIVKEAIKDVIYEMISNALTCEELSDEDYKVLRALALSKSFSDAAALLGIKPQDLADKIVELKKRGIIRGKGDFRDMRLEALIKVLCKSLWRA